MSSLVRPLIWPVASLLVIGGTHLVGEALRPELHDALTSAVTAPILLAIGAWGGYAVRRDGGGAIAGFVAGAILGILPAVLHVVGFALLLGRDAAAEQTTALFSFLAMLWGGAIGAGVASALRAGATAPERSVAVGVEPALSTR